MGFKRAVVSVVAGLSAVLLPAAPALASPSTGTVSSGDAGYGASVSVPLPAKATGTITVPTLACAGEPQEAVVPEIMLAGMGANNTYVDDAGTIWLQCDGQGNATYTEAVYVNNSAIFGFSVNPGDKIKILITVTSTQSTVKLTDVTTGQSASGTGPTFTPQTFNALDTPINNGPGLEPIPNFGKIRFSGVTLNGSPLSSYSPTKYVMRNSSGTVQISTSNLNTTGDTFSTIFRAH